jgi:hypothetical protein
MPRAQHTKFLLGAAPAAHFTVEVNSEGWGAGTSHLWAALERAEQESAWTTGIVVVRDWVSNIVAAFQEGERLY